MNNKLLHRVAFIFLIVGGLNWLLIGVFNDMNIVEMIFGVGTIVSRAAYVLVGFSALYELFTHKDNCTRCSV